MNITIEYCTLRNYEPRAASLAAELHEKYPNAGIELISSRGGRFEVLVDGAPVFEKSKLGRHAKPGEIAGLIEKKTAAARQ